MRTTHITAKLTTTDAKAKERRYRNILANSGEIMESGEIRDIKNLYVMGYDGELYRIADLNTDPEKQTERYSVKAQADHGKIEGDYLVPSIEKQFGSCKVWLEKDGLHARMYFADGDALADHAYAISEDASYSIGADWYPDGYYGTGYEIDEPIGILREISMVLTGNDPRAKTIDRKGNEAQAQEARDEASDKSTDKGDQMSRKIDELTPDERKALGAELSEVLDKFTVDVPEDETEPTADSTEAEAEPVAEATEPEAKEEEKEATADSKGAINVLVIKDRKQVAHQETKMTSIDAYLKTDKAVAAWGKAILDSKGDKKAFADAYRKYAKADGIDLGENVSLPPEAVINAVAEQITDEDRIFSHVFKTGLAYEVAPAEDTADGATGHVRGQTKKEENQELAKRVLVPADLYKLVKLDHSMVKINGGIASSAIVRYVLREMPRKLADSLDQAILVGGVKNDDASQTDFTALQPIITDIATGASIYGVEYTPDAGDSMRAIISKAASRVRSGYDRYLITTEDNLTDIENSLIGSVPTFPNGINKADPRINGIRRIITPSWLTATMLGDYVNGIIVDLPNYHTVGDDTPERIDGYDIDTNKYVWELVACIGGGLVAKNAAVGIKAQA